MLGYADTSVLRIGEAKVASQFSGVNMYANMIDDADGLHKIENLETHENNMRCETAAHLLMSCGLKRDNGIP